MFNFGIWTSAINTWLTDLVGYDWLVTVIECVAIAVIMLVMYALLAMLYIFYERKLCAWFQCRLGPMRVGKWGLLQLFADVIKMLIKEIISVKGTDKFLYALAPYLVIISSVVMFCCLPWGNGLQIIDFNIGIFFILAVSSVGVLGILLAGWASNSKYTLIGAMRSGAQMISYEISLGLAILTIIVLSGTMNISELVAQQESAWFIFKGHIPAIIAFLIYIVAATAETNRGPFDLPEAEHELTAGYHTEYSGMHFGFFYLAEYLNLFIVSGIASLMFLGGWMPLHVPGWDGFNAVMNWIPSPIWFIGKALFVSYIIIWFKWTFPRVRIDQMLSFEWKYLMPLSLANIVLMAVFVGLGWHF
ncbi:MAG: NADH-quinone oxidoreductase subunit NuoH [Prevotella sp.]|nr:NADH-quinone oxidoreductase subunit NuoH [Bacteroides sp.]MCM1365935.1 NADH-quinone oxidoreductase subunit NuoH [Prevotella sp.]MCM1436644.1 NADH-quinone oxidoreductase subunit NuoH [Prevotella sp.]